MAKVVAKSYFDVVGASQDEGLKCEDPSLAVQAPKEECDINNIVKRYLRTGELPQVVQGVYADVSQLSDLATAMEIVDQADAAFMALPAEIRREFDNDPRKLVEFAADPSNLERAYELGLAVRPLDAAPPAGQAGKAGTEPAAAPKGAV